MRYIPARGLSVRAAMKKLCVWAYKCCRFFTYRSLKYYVNRYSYELWKCITIEKFSYAYTFHFLVLKAFYSISARNEHPYVLKLWVLVEVKAKEYYRLETRRPVQKCAGKRELQLCPVTIFCSVYESFVILPFKVNIAVWMASLLCSTTGRRF